MRLKALNMLSEDGALTLFKRCSARWGAKSEPGDGDRVPEQPRLLRRTIDLLVDENVMPLASIPQRIGLAASDIEALAGLREGYFEGRSNVVQFARMRNSSPASSGQSDQPSTVVPFKAPVKT